jgi:hypothetical protein
MARKQRLNLQGAESQLNSRQWEAALEAALHRVDKTRAQALVEPKSAPWKIALAAYLKITTTVSNPWLAAALHMGGPAALSRYVTECRTGLRPETAPWLEKISKSQV